MLPLFSREGGLTWVYVCTCAGLDVCGRPTEWGERILHQSVSHEALVRSVGNSDSHINIGRLRRDYGMSHAVVEDLAEGAQRLRAVPPFVLS